MTGQIGILNVGAGDTKLTFDPNKPAEMKTAARAVTDMIKRGFVILIEAGKDAQTGEALFKRVREFREDTCEYIIAGDAADSETDHEQPSAKTTSKKAVGKIRTPKGKFIPLEAVPAAAARGIAVGRTAGG